MNCIQHTDFGVDFWCNDRDLETEAEKTLQMIAIHQHIQCISASVVGPIDADLIVESRNDYCKLCSFCAQQMIDDSPSCYSTYCITSTQSLVPVVPDRNSWQIVTVLHSRYQILIN